MAGLHSWATEEHEFDSGMWQIFCLNFKLRIKSHLPFAGIIKSSPYSLRFQDKG